MASIQEEVKNYNLGKLRASQEANKHRFKTGTSKAREKLIAEWKPDSIVVQEAEEEKIMTYEEAKAAFWSIYNQAIFKNRPEKAASLLPVLTERNKRNLGKLVKYMILDDSYLNDNSLVQSDYLLVDKGLYIFGDYGTGKTELLFSLSEFSRLFHKRFSNVRKWAPIKEYKKLFSQVKDGKKINYCYTPNANNNFKIVSIDDLGFKDVAEVKHFGNSTNVIDEIVTQRYTLWRNSTRGHNASRNRLKELHLTNMTSNLPIDKIAQDYGNGVSSRIEDMCNIIFWDGENHRSRNSIVH